MRGREWQKGKEPKEVSPQKRTLPKNLDDLVEFFETHDMGDYWDQIPEAQFEIDIKKRTHLIAAHRINAIAKTKKTSPTSLVNSWLREKIQKAS